MKQNETEDSGPIEFNLRDQMDALVADVLRAMSPLVKRFDDLMTTDRILREGMGNRRREGAVRREIETKHSKRGPYSRTNSYRGDVMEIVRSSQAPLTHKEILAKLEERHISPQGGAPSVYAMMSWLLKAGLVHKDAPSPEERRLGIGITWSATPSADTPAAGIDLRPESTPPVGATPPSSVAPRTITRMTLDAIRQIGRPAKKAEIVAMAESIGEPLPSGSNSALHTRIRWALTHETEAKRLIKKGLGKDATYRLK